LSAPAAPEVVVTDTAADTEVPKTGSSSSFAIISMIALSGCAVGLVVLRKTKREF